MPLPAGAMTSVRVCEEFSCSNNRLRTTSLCPTRGRCILVRAMSKDKLALLDSIDHLSANRQSKTRPPQWQQWRKTLWFEVNEALAGSRDEDCRSVVRKRPAYRSSNSVAAPLKRVQCTSLPKLSQMRALRQSSRNHAHPSKSRQTELWCPGKGRLFHASLAACYVRSASVHAKSTISLVRKFTTGSPGAAGGSNARSCSGSK